MCFFEIPMYFLHAVPHSMTFPPFSSISMGQTSWERQFRTALTAACPLTPHYQFKLLTTQPHCSYSLLLVNWSKENHAGIHKHTQRHMHTHTTMGNSSSDDPLQKKVLSEAVLCMLEFYVDLAAKLYSETHWQSPVSGMLQWEGQFLFSVKMHNAVWLEIACL